MVQLRNPAFTAIKFAFCLINVFCYNLGGNLCKIISQSESKMKKAVLVAVANGSEDVETATIISVLDRAGANVTIASVEAQNEVALSHGVKMVANAHINDCANAAYDLIVLPGGLPGAETLRDNSVLKQLLVKQKESGNWYAAICASPAVVLQAHGLLEGVKAVAYPSFMSQISNPGSGEVEISGNCVTSVGPGTAMLFSLKLVEVLYGEQLASKVAKQMVFTSYK